MCIFINPCQALECPLTSFCPQEPLFIPYQANKSTIRLIKVQDYKNKFHFDDLTKNKNYKLLSS